jgi:cysteine-rich repeat protein
MDNQELIRIKRTLSYIFLVVFIFVSLLIVQVTLALEPVPPSSDPASSEDPFIRCNMPEELLEGQQHSISCRVIYTTCLEYNSTDDCISPIEEWITSFSLTGISNSSHEKCLDGSVSLSPVPTNSENINLNFITKSVEGSINCGYEVNVVTNLTSSGENYSVTGTSRIIDNQTSLHVDVDVIEVVEDLPSVGDGDDDVIVILNRDIRFRVISDAINCRYRFLGIEGNYEVTDAYNYDNATTDCLNMSAYTSPSSSSFANLSCGDMSKDTSSSDLFIRELKFGTDIEKAKYGFYCQSQTDVMGFASVKFTIDTLPPRILNDSSGNVLITFKDKNDNIINSTGVQYSESKQLEMFFDTNEDAICKYEVTSSLSNDYSYSNMQNIISSSFTKAHSINITPFLGLERYFYFGCEDRFGNNANTSQVQSYRDGSSIMFLLSDPYCGDMDVTANDVENNQGGEISLSWKRSNQDGINEDFVNQYVVFRINGTNSTSFSNEDKNDKMAYLFSGNETIYDNLSIKRITTLSATGSENYTYIDATTTDGIDYYYYIVARHYAETEQIRNNILYNMSCIASSDVVQSIDQGYPTPVTNLSLITIMNDILGETLKLTWNLSKDDPNAPSGDNNSMDVSNYTIYRADGQTNITAGIYSPVATLNAGQFEYIDINLNYSLQYCYIIQTTDNSGLSTNSTSVCGRPNSQPFFKSLDIIPNDPTTIDDLTCMALITDVDGDDLRENVNITWQIFNVGTHETVYVNQTASCTPPIPPGPFQNHNFTNYTTECLGGLSSDYFNKADKVWCTVTAFDGQEYAIDGDGLNFMTELVFINNTPPYSTDVQVLITPDSNYSSLVSASDNLYCNYTFNDIDGDLEDKDLAQFEWYINNDGMNDFVKILGQTDKMLHNSFIDQNDVVKCAVKVHDKDNSWLNNPLQEKEFTFSGSVLVRDNSIPQIIDYSSHTNGDPNSNITLVGNNVIFNVKWLDTDKDRARMYVCDAFGSYENQASDKFNTTVYFGDNNNNEPIRTILYTNQTGKYVGKISINPYKFVRNSYEVYAPKSMVYDVDLDYNENLVNFTNSIDILFNDNLLTCEQLSFYDNDMSGMYSLGKPLVCENGTIPNVYQHDTDIIIKGSHIPNFASLTPLSTRHKYLNHSSPEDFNPDEDFIYFVRNISEQTISHGDFRSEGYVEDWDISSSNRNIFNTHPIYDMYVYEVDNPGDDPLTTGTLIARDNNNVFVLGRYNHFNPEFNAQPLPGKHLAFVLCIDTNDDGVCDSNSNFLSDGVYVRALDSEPTDNSVIYYVNQSNESQGKFNPDIMINYESSQNDGGCMTKSFCSTDYSYDNQISCLYNVNETDNQNQPFAVRVCDEYGACSIVRTGTFGVNKIPEMTGVFIGSDSNSTAIGTQNNLMCMHTGASSIAPQGDFVLVADGDKTIFGDVRNYIDSGLTYGSDLHPFNDTGLVSYNGNNYNLTFVMTHFEDGVSKNRTDYKINRDALIIDITNDGIYDSTQDIIIYNPFNSLSHNITYYLHTINESHRLSFHDSNSDNLYTFSNSNFNFNPEDIIYNIPGSDLTTFNANINYTFLWYVKPLGEENFTAATNFSWIDNDYNDILTHGNTMVGDRWLCQVTAIDQYGYSNAMNSSFITIGSGGVTEPGTLAPKIHNIWDDSNTSNPTPIGQNMTVWINFSDPDSTQIKAYMCNSSNIIRNSGCWEKEFSRKIYDASPAGVNHVVTLEYIMEDIYTNTPTNYSIMLCDPEYHCSDVVEGNFSANNAPYFDENRPFIQPNNQAHNDLPLYYLSDRNLYCNASFLDADIEGTIYKINNTHWGNTTENWEMQPRYSWYRERDGLMEKVFSNTTSAILSSGATWDNDWWICEAKVYDNYGIPTIWKNSSAIRIGSIVYDTEAPQILNVTTNYDTNNPYNIGDILNFTIQWTDDSSVSIYICNSTNIASTGCIDTELARYEHATNNTITISTITNKNILSHFTNSSSNILNYHIFAVDDADNIGNYSFNYSNLRNDILAVNVIPYINGTPSISNTSNYLNCNYSFVDYDDYSIYNYDFSSIYSDDESLIAWYNKTDSDDWQRITFPASNNSVPSYLVQEGDTWICEITPYDGYVYGIPKNSSTHIIGDMSPQIIDYQILSINSPEFKITNNETPLTLGNDIIIRVWWQDPDDDTTTLFVLNDSNFASAKVYGQNTSSISPIEVRFNSNQLDISDNSTWNTTISFMLVDSYGDSSKSDENLTIYVNRIPHINDTVNIIPNTSDEYVECSTTSHDPDNHSNYQSHNNISYLWWVNNGAGWELHPNYNESIIPFTIMDVGQAWKCQATPCDDFSCGIPENSSVYYEGVNETPFITDLKIFNYPNITLNTNVTPVKHTNLVLFNISWEHVGLYTSGVNLTMYICENVSTKFGCVNGTTWCTNVSTTGVSSCVLNTTKVNMSKYFNNGTFPYSIYLYDDLGNRGNQSGNVSIALPPYVLDDNVTISPQYPTNSQSFNCSANIINPNNESSIYIQNTTYYNWYRNRNNTGYEKTEYKQYTITQDITEKLDRWICQVTPSNNYVNGTPVNSTFITVGNDVSFTDYPNITNVMVNSNSSHRVLVGEKAQWSIQWTDAQQPDEYLQVFVCRTNNFINNTGCVDGGFANFHYTQANPIVVDYIVKENDVNNITNGNLSSYIMLCDSTGLCSDINETQFFINDKPIVSNVTITSDNINEISNLYCNYTLNPGNIYTLNDSSVRWFKYDASVGYCGDSYINSYAGEQCDGNNLGGADCTLFGFTGGTLQCDPASCQYDTTLCKGGTGAYCGDGEWNNEPYEQCDIINNQTGQWEGKYNSCSEIGSFTGGTLACNHENCLIDVSGCTGGGASFCGNGVLEFGEKCETVGDRIIGEKISCSDFDNFIGGTLGCINCEYDTSNCIGHDEVYEDLLINEDTLPSHTYTTGDILVCEVTPFDGYNYGTPIMSNEFYGGLNQTPKLTSVTTYNYFTQLDNIVNSPDKSALYGDNVTVMIDWDDFDSYTIAGEEVIIYVCNQSGANLGGCHGNQLCRIPSSGYISDKQVSCSFNTTKISLDNNITNGTNLTYHIHIFDSTGDTSSGNYSLYVNDLPNISNYKILNTLNPATDVFLNNSNLNCTYDIYDPNYISAVHSNMNQTNTYFSWFYKRVNSDWQYFPDTYGSQGQIIVNSFTQIGDEWKCMITYGDGVANATPVNTTSVIIMAHDYNETKPNVTNVTIYSGNPSSTYETINSNATIYKYDNTTNVGDNIDFTIEWVDKNQLNNNNEFVKVYICNSTSFINNSGCLDRTLFFRNYTNANPIHASFTTMNLDNSIQEFSIYLCDINNECSDPVTDTFMVNHAPGNYKPDVMTYIDVNGNKFFECDYETGYEYRGGSGDSNSTGRLLRGYDDIYNADIIWYINTGSGFVEHSETTNIISPSNLTQNEKIKCGVNVIDAYGLSTGFMNSSVLGLATAPTLWPISDFIYQGTFIVNESLLDNTNLTNLIGIAPNLPQNDVSVYAIAYNDFQIPKSNSTSNINRSSFKGTGTIALSTFKNQSHILVNRFATVTTVFEPGNYINLPLHNLPYFARYEITNVIANAYPTISRVDISPNLLYATNIDDTVISYDNIYPDGWFNFSLELRPGTNLVNVMSNISGALSTPSISRVFYDNETPQITKNNLLTGTNNPMLSFNVTDDFFVNSSTIMVNISNSTHYMYHFTSDTSLDYFTITNPSDSMHGDNILCTMQDVSNYSCNIILDLSYLSINSSQNNYTITITANDLLNQSGLNTSIHNIDGISDDLDKPISFAKPIQNSTSLTFSLLVNMTNVTEIEYAVGTAPYPDGGWNSLKTPTNLSSGTSNITDWFASLTKFVDYNYNIYLDDNEAIINSTNLTLDSVDTVIEEGIALKQYNLTAMYFDMNNNGVHDSWEPIFTNTQSTTLTETIVQNITNNNHPILTLSLNTANLPLQEDNAYRISVRYYNNDSSSSHSSSSPSSWTSTNPIIYRKNFVSMSYQGPSDINVYDKNLTHSEPETLIDIAYSNDLRWNWTASIPQHPDQGEYLMYYEYAIGNAPYPFDGWNSLKQWNPVSNTTREMTAYLAGVQPQILTGKMYYLSVRALTSFGKYSNIASSNGIVYDDRTPPLINVIGVGNDNTAPFNVVVDVELDPLVATIEANEYLKECGFSVYRTPFDSNYFLTRRCNTIPANSIYATCNLTTMDGQPLVKGDYTYYISCLDLNGNANTAIGPYSTKEFDFTYTYNSPPNVTDIWTEVKDSYDSNPVNRSYVYKDEYLFCNYNVWDEDGDDIIHSDTEYRWYKNSLLLPEYENKNVLNISRYSAQRGDDFICGARVKDSTGRISSFVTSSRIYVNNSAPTPSTLVKPINRTYSKDNLFLEWTYSSDIDNDNLYYYLILMNKTAWSPYYIINETLVASNENNNYNLIFNSYNPQLSDGNYTWMIKTCDDSNYSNNCTNSTNMFWVVKDTKGPLVNIIAPDNISSIGLNFNIHADVYDANEPFVNVSTVWANFTNITPSNTTDEISIVLNNYSNSSYYNYVANVSGELTEGKYNMTIYSNDTLGNLHYNSKIINITPISPRLQIDWPPWSFREQYLNSSFVLNLTIRNASTMNYTIKDDLGLTVKTNHKVFSNNQQTYIFNDTVDVSSLSDGRYVIDLYAIDTLGNSAEASTWFVVDKTPPENGTAIYPNQINFTNPINLSIEWFNNSLDPDDNQYGVKQAWFYFVNTTNSTVPDRIYTNDNISIDYINDTTYIKRDHLSVDDSTYNYVIQSQYSQRNNYIHWYSCAQDYAGNKACSPTYTITVITQEPKIIGNLTDIIMYSNEGNDTINLSQVIAHPDGIQLNYSAVILPDGVLLYDPLDSEEYTSSIQGISSDINRLFVNVINGNATFIQRSHKNLLSNPGLELNYDYVDIPGNYETLAPSNWVLKNYAQYNNTNSYNYTIYPGDSAGVNVTAKHYFYQNVSEINSSKNYTLSMWMKLSSNTGNERGRLHINWYDDNSYINSTINLTDDSARPSLNSTWQRHHLTVSPPQNANMAQIYLDSDHNDTWVLIDNVIFEETDYPTYYNKQNYTSGYIKYPVQPSNSWRPYINKSQGTLQISLMPLWGETKHFERYLFNSENNLFSIKTYSQGNQNYLMFRYNETELNISIDDWQDNSVYRLAFTWDNNNLTAYVNGTLNESLSISSSLSDLGDYFYLGSDNNKQKQIDAVLDEFVIYDYAKSQQEIQKDYNTIPVTNDTNTNSSQFTLIYINYTMATNNVTPLINTSSNNHSDFTYNQRIQFFSRDVSSYLATNVINVRVISENNEFVNVTLINNTGTFSFSNNISLNVENNISSSRIHHSVLHNLTGNFSINGVEMNYAIINDSNIVGREIINSNITNTTIINSEVVNSTLVRVISSNSIFKNSIVYDLEVDNIFINPSIVKNVEGENFSIKFSEVYNSNILHSSITNATLINNSNITGCDIYTFAHFDPHQNETIYTNVTIENAILNGQNGKCQLLNGTVIVYNNNTDTNYSFTANETFQPYLNDLWKTSPKVTIITPSDNETLEGNMGTIIIMIEDDGIYNSMGKNISLNITYSEAVFNNIYNETFEQINGSYPYFNDVINSNYFNLNYNLTLNASNVTMFVYVVDNEGKNHNDSVLFNVNASSTINATCGNGIIEQGETCDDGNTLNGDGCSITCQIESGWTCSGEPSVCSKISQTRGTRTQIDSAVVTDLNQTGSGLNLTPYQPKPIEPPTPPTPPSQPSQPSIPTQPTPDTTEISDDSEGFNWLIFFIMLFIIVGILIALGILIYKEKKKFNQNNFEKHSLENEFSNKTSEQSKNNNTSINNNLKNSNLTDSNIPLSSGHSISDVSTAGLYAKQPVPPNGPMSDSIINLEKYILNSLDAGLKPSRVKEIIINSGWDHSVVEVIMHKIMLSGDKLDEVELFISKQISKGISDQQISDALVKNNWSKEIVDLIISDVHKISKNTKYINNYVTKKLSEGKSLDQIHQILVSIGWNEMYIEHILEKYLK